MFEIESKGAEQLSISTKKATVNFDVAAGEVDANLAVGKLKGAGEFEIGDISIIAIRTASGKIVYNVETGGVRIGIIGANEENLDDIVANVLCTSSVRAVREIEPKLVVAMGNVDGMVSELKVAATSEKKLKVKGPAALPESLTVVALI